MITIEEARDRVKRSLPPPLKVQVPVANAAGRRLYFPVKASLDLPLFNQSAMDGFAVSGQAESREGETVTYVVVGETKAGDPPVRSLKPGTAVRIFTGAAVPAGAYCVVIQENVTRVGDRITFNKEVNIREGANIRVKGNQVRKGTAALEAGSLLTPASIGFLQSLGLSKIHVYSSPRVSVLGTGDELLSAGSRLRPGKIFESNTGMLAAALESHGFSCRRSIRVRDELGQVVSRLKRLIDDSDIVVICGGISAGKYDLVRQALTRLKVTEVFYKVSQKPGKPMYFGTRGKKLIFALPGNPAAVLVGFYMYILPSLRRMTGDPDPELPLRSLPLLTDFSLNSDRDLFLKAVISGGGVQLLKGQDSDNLKSFAEANALIFLKAGSVLISRGTPVPVYELPNYSR